MAKTKNVGNTCAISVIVALYNAENYVSECLDSLLNQTFSDFEVIVVDDCSTDKSVAVVEEFVPKFEGRLKLFKSKKNSGFPGVPRNTALKFARGKYLTFLDSDDFFTPTALEEIYKIAEETGAEIIHAGKHFRFTDGKDDSKVFSWPTELVVEEPTLEPEDLGERMKRMVNFQTLWWACSKLFRRDFLEKNNITFPNATAWEDMTFMFCGFIRAKNYVRVPNIFYNYRVRNGSLSHKGRDAMEMTRNLMETVRVMDKYMMATEYFVKNPEPRWLFLDWYIQNRIKNVAKGFYNVSKLKPFQVDRLFHKLLSSSKEDNSTLMSYFFTNSNWLKAKEISAPVRTVIKKPAASPADAKDK